MQATRALETFWIEYSQDEKFVLGIGVTAFSQEDAFLLIKECGIDHWFDRAREMKVTSDVRIEDLDQKNVVPNIGPLQLRGVWYPCMNIGFGAPKGDQFLILDDAADV